MTKNDIIGGWILPLYGVANVDLLLGAGGQDDKYEEQPFQVKS